MLNRLLVLAAVVASFAPAVLAQSPSGALPTPPPAPAAAQSTSSLSPAAAPYVSNTSPAAAAAPGASVQTSLGGPSAGKTLVTWYGHSAFVVTTPKGTVIAIDPWFSNPWSPDKLAAAMLPKVDFILVSHGHADHVGEAVALAQRTRAKFVGPFELAEALMGAGYPMDRQGMMATAGNIGGTIPLTDEVAVSIVQAVHSSGFKRTEVSPTEYAGNPVGFVIRIRGGPTLYHTGDTGPFSDIQNYARMYPIDVMLACIGDHFTMGPNGAALMASWARPKYIVPMHYGTFPVLTGTPEALSQALKTMKSPTTMLQLRPGVPQAF